MDFTIPSSMATVSGGAQGKAIHLIADNNIADLSMYGVELQIMEEEQMDKNIPFPQLVLTLVNIFY